MNSLCEIITKKKEEREEVRAEMGRGRERKGENNIL